MKLRDYFETSFPHRIQRGKAKRAMAEKAGITYEQLRRIETGERGASGRVALSIVLQTNHRVTVEDLWPQEEEAA